MSFTTEYDCAFPEVCINESGNLHVRHIHKPLNEVSTLEGKKAITHAKCVDFCMQALMANKNDLALTSEQKAILTNQITHDCLCKWALSKYLMQKL